MKHLPANIGWSIFKNAASQMAGRLFLSVARLGIAVIIVRYAGAERFGEYSLLLSMLLIAEWLVDFGTTDIAVRTICQKPEREGAVLGSLALVKALQALVVFALLVGALRALGYPAHIVSAGIVGGLGLLFYAGVLVWRTLFRCRMTMEKDVAGEVVGILVMAPLVWYASAAGASVVTLIACYTLSRAVFFAVAIALGCREMTFSADGIRRQDMARVFREALPLGLIGLLVCVYDTLAPIMLSKMADMHAVAYYACAMRFVFPVVIIIQAISGTVYTPLAAYWKKSMNDFAKTQQNALESATLIGAGLFCILNAGAEWLVGLVGPEMAEAAAVLRLLSWAVLARTIATMMSPLVIVTGRQNQALWLTILLVACKAAAFAWLIPRYGYLGAAIGDVAVEAVIGMVPMVLLSQYLAGVWLEWKPIFKTLLAALLALLLCNLLGFIGTFWAALLIVPVYLLFALALGALPLKKLRQLAEAITTRFYPPSTLQDQP
jgi:O-antigen/teichoic acid export membrane protein